MGTSRVNHRDIWLYIHNSLKSVKTPLVLRTPYPTQALAFTPRLACELRSLSKRDPEQ